LEDIQNLVEDAITSTDMLEAILIPAEVAMTFMDLLVAILMFMDLLETAMMLANLLETILNLLDQLEDVLILCRHGGGVRPNLSGRVRGPMTSTDLLEATMTQANVVEAILSLVGIVEVILSSTNPENAVSDLHGCHPALSFSSESHN
jgi:hypothetical protein